jgi:hypothetical protein
MLIFLLFFLGFSYDAITKIISYFFFCYLFTFFFEEQFGLFLKKSITFFSSFFLCSLDYPFPMSLWIFFPRSIMSRATVDYLLSLSLFFKLHTFFFSFSKLFEKSAQLKHKKKIISSLFFFKILGFLSHRKKETETQ